MRGYHDELGGPDSIASPSEWGDLGWGDGVTAAGLPASPGTPSAFPSDNPGDEAYSFDSEGRALPVEDLSARYREVTSPSDPPDSILYDGHPEIDPPPSEVRAAYVAERGIPSADTLRHNFLLRRQLNDPGYGASRAISWREKCANGLGVTDVPAVPRDPKLREMVFSYRASRGYLPSSRKPPFGG